MSYKNKNKVPADADKKHPDSTGPSQIITGGGFQEVFGNSNSETIQALGELIKNGYAAEFKGNLTLEDKCDRLIEGIGFSYVEIEELSPGLSTLEDFTLIGSINSDETIENSKITDPDIGLLTPVKGEAFDKFKAVEDAFFQLDAERSRAVKKIINQFRRAARKNKVKVTRLMMERIRAAALREVLSKKPDRGLKKK